MRNFWIALVLPISGCQMASLEAFCAIYTPVNINREAGTAVIQLDRPAAEAIAINEETWRQCR